MNGKGVSVTQLLTGRRSTHSLHWTDIFSYVYLALGVCLMLGPVLWLVLSSFKTPAGIVEFPPTLLPLGQIEVPVEGYDKPLPLFRVTMPDGAVRELAQIRRVGIMAQMVDPAEPDTRLQIPINTREPVREFRMATENYSKPLRQLDLMGYLWNSVIVTVVATAITLLINSMAAYALAIYEFPGRGVALAFVIGTLMVPITIVLVPVYLVVTKLGLVNSLWRSYCLEQQPRLAYFCCDNTCSPSLVISSRRHVWTRHRNGRSTGRSSCPCHCPPSRYWRFFPSCGAGTNSCGHWWC